jgi:hypothetical protein
LSVSCNLESWSSRLLISCLYCVSLCSILVTYLIKSSRSDMILETSALCFVSVVFAWFLRSKSSFDIYSFLVLTLYNWVEASWLCCSARLIFYLKSFLLSRSDILCFSM